MSLQSNDDIERQTETQKTIFLGLRSSKWFIVATVCVAAFTDSFIYGVIIPVLPYSLKERSGVLDQDIQFWNSMLLASFGAAQFVASPIFGYLADKSCSRRTPLLLGFFSTAAATALLYLARNLWLLTLSRFLQGLSASVIYSVGFALLADTVGPDDIGQWMGFVIFSLNTGIMISPSLGGILYDNFGYESLFFAVFSLIGLDVLLRLIMIEKKDRSTFRQPLVLSEDAACAEYGTFQPENSSVGPKKQNLSMPAGTVPAPSEPVANSKSSAGDPLLHSKQQAADSVDDLSHPIPLITLLKSPRILTDLYGAWVTVTVLVSFDAALAIFVEKQFDWGPTGGGLIFLAVTIPIFTAPLAGKLADICPSRKLTAFWFILTGVFISTLCLVTNTNIEPWIQKIILCTSLTFYGFARVLASSPLGADLSRAVASIERKHPGIFGKSGAGAQVFSLYASASAAGVLTGPAWTSFAYGDHSWAFLVISLGALSASVALPLLFMNRDLH